MKRNLELFSVACSVIALLTSIWSAYLSNQSLRISLFQTKHDTIIQDCFNLQESLLNHLSDLKLHNTLLQSKESNKDIVKLVLKDAELRILEISVENDKKLQLFKWKNKSFDKPVLEKIRQNSTIAMLQFLEGGSRGPYGEEFLAEYQEGLDLFAAKCSETTF